MKAIAAMLLLVATGAAEPPARFFDPSGAAGYGDPRPGLRTYLRGERVRGVQHLCIVGYRLADGDRQVWAHWREGRRLILWDGADPDYPASRLGWGRRDLHLRRDVVAGEAAVGSSTYLVSRAWAARTLADCAAHGIRYRMAMR